MSSAPVKVGFVGLSTKGWASMALGPSLLQPALHDRYNLVALSTTSEESASASARKYSEELGHVVKAYHGDSSKIAADPDVDLVVVSVKAPFHKSVVLPIIEAKKDFFIEWPAGTGLKEVTEIAEAARKQGVRAIVGLQARHGVVAKKVKELIDSGKIGKVLSTSLIGLVPRELKAMGPILGEGFAYSADKSQGVTLLTIPMGHQLEVFTHILGDFATVSASGAIIYPVSTLVDKDGNPTGKTVKTNAPDHVAFTGILKSGAVASMNWRVGHTSTKGRRQFIWEIDGEDGSIRLESDEISGAFMGLRDPKLYLNGELVELEAGGLIPNLTNAWVEFAKGDAGQYATLDDAVRNHRLIDAIERSIEEGKTIAL